MIMIGPLHINHINFFMCISGVLLDQYSINPNWQISLSSGGTPLDVSGTKGSPVGDTNCPGRVRRGTSDLIASVGVTTRGGNTSGGCCAHSNTEHTCRKQQNKSNKPSQHQKYNSVIRWNSPRSVSHVFSVC
jgi:hypothetical protein